jgi:hypothetical protein
MATKGYHWRRAHSCLLVVLNLALFLGGTNCSVAQVTMNPNDPILPAERFREIAGQVAATNLPDEIAETLPVITEVRGGPEVLIIFYRETGKPNRRTVHPPTHFVAMHPASGAIIRFAKASPRELGIRLPVEPVAGVGIDSRMSMDDFIAKDARFLEISAPVWRLFLNRSQGPLDDGSRALVREYWDLFAQTTKAEVAPFYIGAAPDFFSWVRSERGQ